MSIKVCVHICRCRKKHFDAHFQQLGPFIFCRKLENTHPMREELNRRVVYFPPGSTFFHPCLIMGTLFYVCTFIWPVNNLSSLKKVVKIGKMKVRKNRTIVLKPLNGNDISDKKNCPFSPTIIEKNRN